jgi:hypothetical protein
MSIVLPGKPNWKVTLEFDDKGQCQINVQDVMNPRSPIPRALNQIQLASMLTGAVQSILATTLQIASRRGNGTEKT